MGAGETGFDDAYDGTPPWDIGRPQREVVRLAEAGKITGDVLDVGCGTGENALWLADQGYTVCGLDASPRAIEKAERKATERGVDATFLTHDAFDLGALDRRFDTVVDCGLFHVFSGEERVSTYTTELHTVLRPGGRCYVLGFTGREPDHQGPSMTRAEVRAAFADGWTVDTIDEVAFETNFESGESPAWLATVTRR